MERLLRELVTHGDATSITLLRSTLTATQVVVDFIKPYAKAVAAELVDFDMRDPEADPLPTVATALQAGSWVYIANIAPEHDTLLRKLAVLLFTTECRAIHPSFRLWMSTLTKYTAFEPPPSFGAVALPRVLLHLCNSPRSLLGDMDTMEVVKRHRADPSQYDGDAFAGSMADIAERLTRSDPDLTSLSFEEQKVTGVSCGDEFFAMLPEALRLNNVLTNFDIRGCGIGDAGVEQMARVLAVSRSLRVLDLSRNLVSDAGMAALRGGLCANTSLRTLNLSGNPVIGDSGLEALGEGLSAKTLRLEELIFDGNNTLSTAPTAWTRRGVIGLWKGVAASRCLRKLTMKGCGLSGRAVQLLVDHLESTSNTVLTHLDLSENRIGDAGARALGRLVKHSTTSRLAEVKLDDCGLGLPSYVTFGAAMKSSTVLTTLSLAHSTPCSSEEKRSLTVDEEEESDPTPSIPPEVDEEWDEGSAGYGYQLEGVEAIAQGLTHTRSLSSLSLAYCQLVDPAVAVLMRRLEENTTVTDLTLSGNFTIGSRGAQCIQYYLRGGVSAERVPPVKRVLLDHNDVEVGERGVLAMCNSGVEEISLASTGINDAICMALRDALDTNKCVKLRKIDLSGNTLGQEGLQRISEILLQHRTIEEVDLSCTLQSAHQEATNLRPSADGAPDGLPSLKDSGLSVVRPFFANLAKLRAESSSLRLLKMCRNTLTDACIECALSLLRNTNVTFVLDLTGNLHSHATMPLIDGFNLQEEGAPKPSITIDPPAEESLRVPPPIRRMTERFV